MVSSSKIFNEAVLGKTCAYFLHPNETCWDMCKDLLINNVYASFYNYFPTCVVPLLFKINDWNKKLIYESLSDYLKCAVAGYFLSLTSMTTFCMFSKLTNSFKYSTFVFIPCLIGAPSLLLSTPKVRYIQALGLINIFIESLIKRSENNVFIKLRESKMIGTILFMIFSAFTMYGFKATTKRRFWFTSIPKQQKKNEEIQSKICSHSTPCQEYLKEELTNAGKLALLFGLSKFVVTHIKVIVQNPKNIISIISKNLDYGFMMFMFSYGGIYKITNCILNNTFGKELTIHSLYSGFFCGLSYIFYSKYAVFSFGLTSAIELLWTVYIETKKNKSKLMERFIQLPFTSIIVIFFIAYSFHLRVVRPDITSQFIHKMMATGTSYRTESLARGYASIMGVKN